MSAPKTEPWRRVATEAERTLFYATLADARPLKPHARALARTKKKPTPAPARIAKPKPAPKPAAAPRDVPPEIGGHRSTPLKRGRLEPEARLDLHGLTQESAHRTLVRFLARARANNARLVLVITGKSGVLNKQFKLWLAQGELKPLVSGVSSAHKRHGGSGAYYILLKRARETR
jgi:DNA-nicking Smr family endonuclease